MSDPFDIDGDGKVTEDELMEMDYLLNEVYFKEDNEGKSSYRAPVRHYSSGRSSANSAGRSSTYGAGRGSANSAGRNGANGAGKDAAPEETAVMVALILVGLVFTPIVPPLGLLFLVAAYVCPAFFK